MTFKKSLLLTSLFLLSFFSISSSLYGTPAYKKCKAETLQGKWYGKFRFSSGNAMLMVLEVENVKKCTVSGTIHFPDYFNDKVTVEGSIEDNVLTLYEKRFIQGFEYGEKNLYKIPLTNTKELNGEYLTKTNETYAYVELKHESAIKGRKLSKLQKQIAAKEEIFGKVLISDQKVSMTQDELIAKYKQTKNEAFTDSLRSLNIHGKATFSGIEFPMEMAMKVPGKMRMSLSFQGTKFLTGYNGKQSWEYNPLEDVLKVEDIEEADGSDFNLAEDNLLDKLEEGYQLTEVYYATIDQKETYRLKLEKEDIWYVCFIDPSNWQIIRGEEQPTTLTLYQDYKQQEGDWYPQTMHQLTLGNNLEPARTSFEIETVDFNVDYEDSYFDVPEELKDKLAETEEEVSFNDLGNEQYSKGEYQKAESYYTKALRNAPNDPVIYGNRGRARLELRKFYEAIADFSRSIELNPEDAETYNYRGTTKYYLGDIKGSIPDFSKAIELDSTFAKAYSNRGYAYSHTENYDGALADFTNAVLYDSANANYHHLKAQMLVNRERYPEAIEAFNKAIELGLQNEDVYNRLGVAYHFIEDYQTAIDNFKKAIELNDTTALYYSNVADAYYALDNYAESAEYLQIMLELPDVEKDEVYNNLGRLYYLQEYYQEAKSYFDKAIEVNANNATYFDNRASVKQELMDFTGAIEDYSMSISLYPDDANIYYLRGMLKTQVQDEFSGCIDFKKAKELGHEEAAKKLAEHCVLESEAKN